MTFNLIDTNSEFNSNERNLGNTQGRASFNILAFWSPKPSNDTISFIIDMIGKDFFKDKIELQYSPNNKRYYTPEEQKTEKYDVVKHTNLSPSDYSKADIIDMYRTKKWPGLKFESKS